MPTVKVLESTGNQQEDAGLFSGIKDNLANRYSLEEAKERERAANQETAAGESRNALTEEPRIKGQNLAAVVVDEPASLDKNGKKTVGEVSEDKKFRAVTEDKPEPKPEPKPVEVVKQ